MSAQTKRSGNMHLKDVVGSEELTHKWVLAHISNSPINVPFWCTRIVIAGIETMHMIKRGQLDCPSGQLASAAQLFYSLAF